MGQISDDLEGIGVLVLNESGEVFENDRRLDKINPARQWSQSVQTMSLLLIALVAG